MEKLPFFYFKEHSSLDFGLYIKEKNVYKGAQRDITYVSVPGRDGDLVIDNGRYKNVKIQYKLELLNNSPRSFAELARVIRNWLLVDPGYFKLWDTYDREYFRLASFSSEVDIEQELRDYGKLNITLNCKPFRYATNGQDTVVIQSTQHLYNVEAHESKPYIRIYGSGTLQLYINGYAYLFKDVNEYIEVDSETKNCFKGTTALNNKMVSDGFPTLVPGDNIISMSAAVTRVEIVPRWCTL